MSENYLAGFVGGGEQALETAGRGRVIGVYCEKPPASTLADQDAMVRIARAGKPALTFGYHRLSSAAMWTAAMLARDVLGDPDPVRVIGPARRNSVN